jgi:hypothetical protein
MEMDATLDAKFNMGGYVQIMSVALFPQLHLHLKQQFSVEMVLLNHQMNNAMMVSLNKRRWMQYLLQN